jgi:predicted dehydrogenase
MTLRVGVLGLGVGERHVAGYRLHPGCVVTTLCDRDPEILAAVAARNPGLRRTTRPEEVLDDPEVDVVSIATWDDSHAEQILHAINNGKHVFAEKPLCLHAHELESIRAALARRPGVRLSSNLVLRTCPRFQDLRQRIRNGELGRLYYMEADYNYGRIHKITQGWRGSLPYYSVFLGGAVHLVDLLLWMTRERVVEVTARGNAIATNETGFRHNDLTVALLTFESGAVAKVAANFACVGPHFHRLLLYGTEATFENFPEHGRLTVSRDVVRPPVLLDAPYPGQHKGDLVAAFIASLLGEPRGAETVAEGEVFAAMAVCLAVEQSSREGRTVTVTKAQPFPCDNAGQRIDSIHKEHA